MRKFAKIILPFVLCLLFSSAAFASTHKPSYHDGYYAPDSVITPPAISYDDSYPCTPGAIICPFPRHGDAITGSAIVTPPAISDDSEPATHGAVVCPPNHSYDAHHGATVTLPSNANQNASFQQGKSKSIKVHFKKNKKTYTVTWSKVSDASGYTIKIYKNGTVFKTIKVSSNKTKLKVTKYITKKGKYTVSVTANGTSTTTTAKSNKIKKTK